MKEAKAKVATPGGFVSTNDIFTSHFFRTTKSKVGMMVINMRDMIKSLPITDNNAGCYEGCLLLDEINYSDSANIRKCLQGGVPFTRQTPSPRLPAFAKVQCQWLL